MGIPTVPLAAINPPLAVHVSQEPEPPLSQAVSSAVLPVFALLAEIEDVEMEDADDAPEGLIDAAGDVVMDDISSEFPEPWASFIHTLISSL